MPPEPPETKPEDLRSRIVAVIDRTQEEAFRELLKAGVPETQALIVMRRINAFCLHTLRELDRVYREFEELLAQDSNRSQAHQEWLDTKAGGLLLTIESFIAALVAETMNQAKEDYRSERSHPREVITTVPVSARSPAWQQALQDLGKTLPPFLLWPAGLGAWFLLWWLVSTSLTWAVIAIGITAFVVFLFEKPGLVFILIAGGVCLLFLL
jgi:hypothetical protein